MLYSPLLIVFALGSLSIQLMGALSLRDHSTLAPQPYRMVVVRREEEKFFLRGRSFHMTRPSPL